MSTIFKLTDKKYLRRNTDKPLIVGNILVDTYLRLINKKLFENKKPSLIEYLSYLSFIMVILNQMVCLRTMNNQIRFWMMDPTLFIGGIRRYNNYVIIIVYFMALPIFKFFFISPDKSYIIWLEIIQFVRGNVQYRPRPLFESNKEHLGEIRLFTNYFNILSMGLYLAFSKFSIK